MKIIEKIDKYIGKKKEKKADFSCQECGHVFKTAAAAERAANSDRGCPKCDGSDIDLRV
jgi:hypothetical protein